MITPLFQPPPGTFFYFSKSEKKNTFGQHSSKLTFWIFLVLEKKLEGVVEITALLLTKITLRKFVSVKSVNDNAVISTTPQNFFFIFQNPKKKYFRSTFGEV